MTAPRFPDAEYLVLSSRLIPDLDGGYTIATLARARQMAACGVGGGSGPLLLTFDPGAAAAHAEHRSVFVQRGDVVEGSRLRNLFDEAVDAEGGAASWLWDAAAAGDAPAPASAPGDDRVLHDSLGRPFLALPVVDDPDWHLQRSPVRLYDAAGKPGAALAGFGALYRAWLDLVVDEVTAAAAGRPVVVICESRQIGELLAQWFRPGVTLLHTVHTTHLEAPYTPDAPMNRLWTRWFEGVRRFDAVLWPTSQQRDDIVARFGEPDRHRVVPNAVEASGPALAPREPGLVVALARLAAGKRLDHSIRAFLAAEVPGARLEIWGDGPMRPQLQHVIDTAGAADRVRLAGYTTDPGSVLDRASALICSTAFEGQGLALLEALGHGCPVVSYDVRYGPRDILRNGGGVLVDDGDEAALAAALRRVLTDSALHERLRREAVAVAARWSPQPVMRALAAVAGQTLARG